MIFIELISFLNLNSFRVGLLYFSFNYCTALHKMIFLVVVGFTLDDDSSVQLAAWTTTPWTLPSNLCVAVHPDLIYVTVQDKKTGKKYILMEEVNSFVYKNSISNEVLFSEIMQKKTK